MNSSLPPPGPVDVGIVAALSIEVGPLIDLLKDVRTYSDPEGHQRSVIEGMLGDRLVALIVAGVGRSLAAKGARRLVGGHRPRWIVSTGFAGALDPALKRNDVFLANEIVDESMEDEAILSLDLQPPPSPQGSSIRFVGGRLLTARSIARTASQKEILRGRFGAAAVDMETAAIAALCSDRGQRFLSVRVISDEADVDLPPEVLSVMGPTGGFRLGATIGALWKRPSSVKDLWTLREHALEAADRLAEVLPGLLEHLT